MARGVSENFLKLARREERLGRRAVVVAALVAFPAAFLAELADDPGYGPVWLLFLAFALLGVLAGMVWAQRRLAHYEDDLRLQWNHWMRHAVRAQRLAEVESRTHDRDPLPSATWSAATALLVLLNAALFALLWAAHPAGALLAWPVIGLDGLVLGAAAASSALLARWCRDFVRSAEEMVERGELAMWGER